MIEKCGKLQAFISLKSWPWCACELTKGYLFQNSNVANQFFASVKKYTLIKNARAVTDAFEALDSK